MYEWINWCVDKLYNRLPWERLRGELPNSEQTHMVIENLKGKDKRAASLHTVLEKFSIAELRIVTVKQPTANLCIAGIADVLNLSWPVPSTLPQWGLCHGERMPPEGTEGWVDYDSHTEPDHHPQCDGLCRHCPVPVQCGPVKADGPIPFRLGIHAAKDPIDGADLRAAKQMVVGEAEYDALASAFDRDKYGVLLGTVEVTGYHHANKCMGPPDGWDAHPSHCSQWAKPGVYHWIISDPQPLDVPIQVRGRPGMWTISSTSSHYEGL